VCPPTRAAITHSVPAPSTAAVAIMISRVLTALALLAAAAASGAKDAHFLGLVYGQRTFSQVRARNRLAGGWIREERSGAHALCGCLGCVSRVCVSGVCLGCAAGGVGHGRGLDAAPREQGPGRSQAAHRLLGALQRQGCRCVAAPDGLCCSVWLLTCCRLLRRPCCGVHRQGDPRCGGRRQRPGHLQQHRQERRVLQRENQ